MSFPTRTDYFGLADSTLVLSDDNDGKTASEATALGDDGSVVACEVFGENLNPSNTYKIAGDVTADIVLGGVNGTTAKIALGSVSITTGADVEPTVQASGTQVESTATNGCTYTVSLSGLTKKRHAQKLFSMFTLGTGDYSLTGANYTIDGAIGKATVDGDCVAFDICQGKITAQLTIVCYGSSAPTVTAGSDCKITAPLAKSAPDAQYPTYTCTVTKYLAKDSN